MLVTTDPTTVVTTTGTTYEPVASIVVQDGSRYAAGFYTTYQGVEDTTVLRMAGKHQTRGRYPTTYGLVAHGPEFVDRRDVPEAWKDKPLTGGLSARGAVISAQPIAKPITLDVNDGDHLMIGLHAEGDTVRGYLVQIRDDRRMEDPRLVFLAEMRDGAWYDLHLPEA